MFKLAVKHGPTHENLPKRRIEAKRNGWKTYAAAPLTSSIIVAVKPPCLNDETFESNSVVDVHLHHAAMPADSFTEMKRHLNFGPFNVVHVVVTRRARRNAAERFLHAFDLLVAAHEIEEMSNAVGIEKRIEE